MPLSNPPSGSAGAALVKYFTDGATLLGGPADFPGQVLAAADGSMLAVAGPTIGSGAGQSLFLLNSPLVTGVLEPFRIDQDGPSGFAGNWLSAGSNLEAPCVLSLHNKSAGPTALALQWQSSDSFPAALIGLNLPTEGGAGVLQLLGQARTSGMDPASVQVIQRVAVQGHLRLHFDGADHTTTAYGWAESAFAGAIGWHIAADGRVGIGTSSLEDDCLLTVQGSSAGHVALRVPVLRLISPSSSAPVIIGETELGLRTEDSVSSIQLRSGTGPTEYTAGAGTASAREGHRFRTGATPATRLAIADNAVVADVPVQLPTYAFGSQPSAAGLTGALILMSTNFGATVEIAFSDGSRWLRLVTGEPF